MKEFIFKIILIELSLILIGALIFFLVEGIAQEITFLDSVYYIVITYSTIGYGDISPKTPVGRVIAMCFAFIGVATMAGILGYISTIFIQAALKGKNYQKMVDKMEKFTLICGYDKKLDVVIGDLKAEGDNLVVVADSDVPEGWDKSIAYIKADPTNFDALKRIGVEKATRALISLGDDSKTLLTVMNIESINSDCFTIADIKDKNYISHFQRINTDKIICEDKVLGKVLAVTVSNPEVSDAYDELNSTEGNDLHSIKAIKFNGLSFQEIIPQLKKQYNALAVGIIREKKIILNPDLTEKVQGSDLIVVISQEDLE